MISQTDWKDWHQNLTQNTNTTSNTSASNSTNKSNTTSDTSTSNSTNNTAANPKAVLDKDAFLKLLLVELEHQDPTDPMDSEKMLTQTSQLAALEMQQNTNSTMQKMVETMDKLSKSFGTVMNSSALSAIGRMATLSEDTIKLDGQNTNITMGIYMPEASNDQGINVEVYDKNNKLVYNKKLDEGKTIGVGLYKVEWNGRNNDGIYAGDGEYSVKLVYNNSANQKITARYGAYPIDGIRFENGTTVAKVAGKEINFDDIKEITSFDSGYTKNF